MCSKLQILILQNRTAYSFWGTASPDSLLQRFTTGFSPLPQKILDWPCIQILLYLFTVACDSVSQEGHSYKTKMYYIVESTVILEKAVSMITELQIMFLCFSYCQILDFLAQYLSLPICKSSLLQAKESYTTENEVATVNHYEV